eukprot:TRINITY_DN19601_c0_g1_i1.p1 TRINITY_DN19601_c0_g1~~TRINITY_DN19601_c0_g1_i1.p1  ORF type:complete len:149 (-),score=30.62 TRINITY_DN19601_c0_g1_i1:148-594(-)
MAIISDSIRWWLLINGMVILVAGILLHFRPEPILHLFHSNPSVIQKETLSVLHGWGGTLICLGAAVIQVGSTNVLHDIVKIYIARALTLGWGTMAHGQFVMLKAPLEKFGNWTQETGRIVFIFYFSMAFINLLVGLLAQPAPLKTKTK